MNVVELMMLLCTGAAIVYVLLPDRGVMSVEEYIRTHPNEFRK